MPITPDVLSVGLEYSRKDLANLFDQPNLATSREGYYGRDGEDYIPFFVTLDKKDANPGVAYNDFFEDGLFFWESQRQNTLQHKWIRRYIGAEIVPLLFVRLQARHNGKTLPFIYAGRLINPVPDLLSERPVKLFAEPIDITHPPPASLTRILDWKPETPRLDPPKGAFAEKVDAKRRRDRSFRQGLESDPKVRKAIEMHAMQVATQAYELQGYVVEDVSRDRPYDLLCKRNAMNERRVEVKGTRGGPEFVNLTAGEVHAAREPGVLTDLYIVHGIAVATVEGDCIASGGQSRVIQNWVPDEKDLEATQYRFRVPTEL